MKSVVAILAICALFLTAQAKPDESNPPQPDAGNAMTGAATASKNAAGQAIEGARNAATGTDNSAKNAGGQADPADDIPVFFNKLGQVVKTGIEQMNRFGTIW
ncbi:unnamed protein product [Arctia plantaginis]|uniref:Uncharacterized protein n=1 Tax=Arctia plantaginis TaxID=874455 RepID=A0A8S0ZTI9_ARCPL|nr:unnamed protein product [Arctia plantaginis]